MPDSAIQDLYSDETSHCYGCGRLNEQGLQLKSYWNGGAAIATFTPDARYMAVPGVVYGGLIASLLDCHGTATAAAAACHAEDAELAAGNLRRFVTAALKIDFLLPTPTGVELELRGTAREVKSNKVVVEMTLTADGKTCVNGDLVAVNMPDALLEARTPA